MTFGEKISTLRKSKGISQEMLADSCRISLRTVQRLESGDSLPRPHTLKVIAETLGVPVEELSAAVNSPISNAQHDHLINLRQINFAGLAGLVIPLANIVIPWWLWRKHRSNDIVNSVGRKIISFQILWTVITVLLIIAARLIQNSVANAVAIGKFPPAFIIVYLMALLVNFSFVLHAAIRLSKEKLPIYTAVPSLI